MNKQYRIALSLLFIAGLSVLVVAGLRSGLRSKSAPSQSSQQYIPSAITPETPPTRSHTPTQTWNSIAQTNMAAISADGTGVARTNTALKVNCPEGFLLELPESVASMSNGEWTVFTCSPRRPRTKRGETPVSMDYRTRFTKVISTDGTREWTISHAQFHWTNRENALLTTYRWSKDGRYLYLLWDYYPGPSGGDASVYFFVFADVALFRLELDTGLFESILPYNNGSCMFTLSPDGEMLAFVNPGEDTVIRIRDLQINEEKIKRLFGEYNQTGAFVWQLDGSSVFFASAMAGWEEG
jgi:hypothetical protein